MHGTMKAKILVYALLALILATIHLAEAQQLSKSSRIGFLGGASPSFYAARIEAFRQGLRELGYAEGKNIVVEYWFAEGKPERMRELAEELVRMKCDVIVTASTPATQAAKRATTTIPIVMANISDPVELGLVASLARPGGNITGLTILGPELSGKRLELLKEALPNLTRVGALWNPTNSSQERIWKEIQAAAQELRLQLQSLEVRSANDIDIAFEAVLRERTQALIPSAEPLINAHLKRIVEFATKNRLPAMYAGPEAVDAGGLMSYAPNYTDQYRRAAIYVDKILKGAKPADLPVEQPTKFEFVINLKTAKQIDLTIPPEVLARATKLIR